MFHLFVIRRALCLANGIHTVVVGVGAAVDDATLQAQQVADVHRSTECNLVHLNEKVVMTCYEMSAKKKCSQSATRAKRLVITSKKMG